MDRRGGERHKSKVLSSNVETCMLSKDGGKCNLVETVEVSKVKIRSKHIF